MNTNRFRVHAAIGAGSAVLVFIGSLLPWMKATAPFVGQISKSGIEDGGDGLWTLLMALTAFGIVAWHMTGGIRLQPTFIALLVLGFLITIIAGYDINNVSGRIDELDPEVRNLVSISVGEGLYLTLIGGLGLGIVGLAVLFQQPHPPESGHDEVL